MPIATVNSIPLIWISNHAIQAMQELAWNHFPLETGGMLIGHVADNDEPVVTKIIGPGPNAIHSSKSFLPDSAFQQKELEKIFFDSNGQETYLGDWHTHPNELKSPSRTDKNTLAKIAHTPESQIAHPIMLILGGGTKAWDFGAIRYVSTTGHLFWRNHNIQNLNLRPF